MKFNKVLAIGIVVVGLIVGASFIFGPGQGEMNAGLYDVNENIARDPVVLADYVRYPGENGKNALELLEKLTTIDKQEFDFGTMVNGINGVVPDENSFWKLYINGQEAQVGARDLITSDTDVIEWKIENINSE